MGTKPISTMPNFNNRVEEFRIWQPETYARNLQGAVGGHVEDNYLFLLCAYDFVFNPVNMENKATFMRNRFFTPEDKQQDSIDGISWAVNYSQECQREIEALLGNPKVMISLEGRNVIPSLNKTPKSATTGNALFAADKQNVGGLTYMGAANFNLFTKAIELACGGIFAMREYIANAIKQHRDHALSAHNRQVLVDRYNVMRQSYGDETLTGFGLIYR